jgi:F-type H+-transporting ATPase subunit delta
VSAVAKRYARALFSLAADEGIVDPTGRELEQVVAIFSAEPLAWLASSASVDAGSKRAVVIRVSSQLNLTPLVSRFLGLVAEKNRLTILPAIAEHYQRFLDQHLGQVRARITSARELAVDAQQKLHGIFEQRTGKKVLAEMAIDPELLGGVVVEIEGRVYDGSVRTQLEAMQKALAG